MDLYNPQVIIEVDKITHTIDFRAYATGTYIVKVTYTKDGASVSDTSGDIIAVDYVIGSEDGREHVMVNYDDDDEDSVGDTYDYDNPDENDLLKIYPVVFTDRPNDKVTIKVIGPYKDCIKIWSSSDKQNRIIPHPDNDNDYFNEWPASSWPPSSPLTALYVEGMKPGSDVQIRISYTGLDADPDQEVTPTAGIDLTVVEVDMDMEGVQDNKDQYAAVTHETYPGGFIAVGQLEHLKLYEVLPNEIIGIVAFDVIAGGSKVAIYDNPQGTGSPIELPAYYSTPSQDPLSEGVLDDLYVKGVEASDSLRDVTLRYLDFTTGFSDVIKLTVVEVNITEAKGLYKANGSYESGYISDDDLGRIYSNRIYDETDLSKTIWAENEQYVDFTVTIVPEDVTLPPEARIVWEWEDPDDPSDSGMQSNAAKFIDENDYDNQDSDGDGNDKDGEDNTGGNPSWESIDGYAIYNQNETEISNGISKVRFNVSDDGGDNFIVHAKIKLYPEATPCAGDNTGVMTVWKKIFVEYVKMQNADALPVDGLPGEFEICFTEVNVEPVRNVNDNYVFHDEYWYMGINKGDAEINAALFGSKFGEFTKEDEKEKGWFFLASAHRYYPVGPASGGEVLYPTSGTADNATALGGWITLPTPIPVNNVPNIVNIYNSDESKSVLFVVEENSLTTDRKSFAIEKKSYIPPLSSYSPFDADLTGYHFPYNSTIKVQVKSPGNYGAGGISWGNSRAIIFTNWVGPDLSTLVHEMSHSLDTDDWCGNWDNKSTTSSCAMNYNAWFILDDNNPRIPIQWTNNCVGTSLCAPHIKEIRQSDN